MIVVNFSLIGVPLGSQKLNYKKLINLITKKNN